jgi:hypothetical protein
MQKNTNSWRARKGDLQHTFHLDVRMVPSSALIIATDGERLPCGGFSLNETIRFGSLKFITNCFGGLSLSPRGDSTDAAIMGSTHNRPPTLLRAMIGESTEEFHTTSGGEGGLGPASPRRRGNGAPPSPAMTISQSEDTLTTQAMMMIPP